VPFKDVGCTSRAAHQEFQELLFPKEALKR